MVNSAFAAIFVVLALGLLAWPRDRTLSFVYFVALTSSNLLLIAVFWSAMSDVWRPELAKRFYGYVAAGGSAGAHRRQSRGAWPGRGRGAAAADHRRLRFHRDRRRRW